ncbi:Nitrilase/cyanide hydratase and apolipoprotein N-acyltransferase [Deinococcus geothermalis DSM 11300]|uniref:Nitrilase/cyanide hydratase and apolipoprotein N-acyltransferase n=1 Tax=Deinococcus geothermalis (strain DSM 11300 / CIP 105573 / AG-3a) TaxID=319795 RepID=Q1IW26_DEIGD|nr:carbon-nitrogen hydrolase family protein [Deinococcus geothermalis]ABF46558.1 Nitrilase/cyanide hydratase and apolipoprotein N-acyltransferase [Deinococcus geothermalis DSM 11300]
MSVLRVAAAAYPVDFHPGWAAYEAKVTAWVADAAGRGARLLVFPEYASLELISLLPPELHHDILALRPALQAFLPEFLALHARLARQHGVGLVAGSFPVAQGGGYVNRAYVFGPNGAQHWQDKLLMTRFEAEEWQIDPGTGVRVFELPLTGEEALRFGVAVCYDSEFPTLARQLAEGGAEVLVVPSFTSARAGYTRVRVGSLARALENQFYAVHAPLIADAAWTYAVEEAVGRASVYAPADHGLPETGIVAEGEWNTPGWLVTDLDLELIRRVREDGHVLNWRDRHAGQTRPGPAEVVQLGVAVYG